MILLYQERHAGSDEEEDIPEASSESVAYTVTVVYRVTSVNVVRV